ncbi:hypothetical protein C475_11690 [Halosimplex carlsbadense 2-9-1]|uniref:Uncharacterized protein n=1 Tax=Halosimplex carlsbadense 2-9-1 TaxID=797114 RepID=M0CR75_9EURY|nr:hypothetical protein [Halosimplex carlsbadense]ELZ24897.1 hypothetical protein C475_11690 [Halosimplex carlsbadense 2-9-1]
MSDDDDLRFGDVKGSDGSSTSHSGEDDLFDRLIQLLIYLFIVYVGLKMAETLLNIQIPVV